MISPIRPGRIGTRFNSGRKKKRGRDLFPAEMGHHGVVSDTNCIHGFPAGQCLICQTLQKGDDGGGGPKAGRRSPTATKPSPAQIQPARPQTVRPDAVLRPAPADRGGSLGLKLAGVAIVVILVVLAGAWIASLVWSVLHLIQLVAAALVAAWLGYQVGVFRGKRLGRGE
jgi:hypothetical protein